MQMSVANTLSYILVVAAIINFEESLTMSQPSVFNARPARRIIGYQCKNPNCLKVFPIFLLTICTVIMQPQEALCAPA